MNSVKIAVVEAADRLDSEPRCEGWMSGRRSGSSGLTGGMAQLREPRSDRTLQQKRRRYKGSGMSRFAGFCDLTSKSDREAMRLAAVVNRRRLAPLSQLAARGLQRDEAGKRDGRCRRESMAQSREEGVNWGNEDIQWSSVGKGGEGERKRRLSW